ncbi:unnamed protein product [Eruca vesicaria subsp. sativa]|uniref:AT-hook motif nuclear-localized protein n=1 Tax=Eruca vesicaria subsp. sativa TaxID=29727 RepID=A0ABC8LCU8_ERUVS|nr:unnamed protein product [Eruca vesicaria subsp. sativa]
MDSKETQQQQQPQENAITPDSLPMLHLHLPQQPLMLEGSSSHYPVTIQEQQLMLEGPSSHYPVATQEQPLMLEGSSSHYPVATQEQPSMQRGVIDGGAANVMLPRGSDIATELVAFLNQEPRDVCILSATGAVSSAWLQSNSPLEIVKYEGLHDIVRLSGTFSSTECHDGTVTITGNLIVSLAGPDNKLVGGRVGGRLVAGSPVQSQGPQFSSESSEETVSEPLVYQVGNSTSQPPHHLHFWPGNNPQ